MKVFINTTEDWDEIKEAVSFAKEYLKDFMSEIKLNKIDLDVSQDFLYETTDTLSWFRIVKTKSIKNEIIRAIGLLYGKTPYDCYGLIVDKNKAIEKTSLFGQQSEQYKTIEVYAYRGRSNRKMWGLPYTTYNLVHELMHAIADHYKIDDTLHEWIDKNDSLDGYLEYLKSHLITNRPDDLLPKITRDSEEFIKQAKDKLGLDLRITSGFRSFTEQDDLYAQGRTKAGQIVTNAKGGESQHNYGIAFDVVDRYKGYDLGLDWYRLALLWHDIGGKETGWGGLWKSFVDKPHFYNDMGYSLKDFQDNKVDYGKFN